MVIDKAPLEKPRRRKSRTSIKGCSARSSVMIKAATLISPIVVATNTRLSGQPRDGAFDNGKYGRRDGERHPGHAETIQWRACGVVGLGDGEAQNQ